MKIKNETHWRTDQMKSIISRVVKDEFDARKIKHLNIRIKYGKGGRYADGKGNVGGHAWYNSTDMVIKVCQDFVDPVHFAHTVAHESAHCRGVRHRQMSGKPQYMYCGDWRGVYAWAAGMTIELKAFAKPKVKQDVQLVRYNRTLTNIKNWETKFKRATNALKKLRANKRYYERCLAQKGILKEDK